MSPPATTDRPAGAGTATSSLVAELGTVLEAEGVPYCQWKGHAGRARWMAGQGDLDLLIDPSGAAAFAGVMAGLGFKLAVAPLGLQLPGVASYLGPDVGLGRLIHVHAHFRIVVGRPWARHYRIPIERAVLEAAVWDVPFRVPAPEFQLLLLVLRNTLRHEVRDLVRPAEPPWLRAARAELAHLEALVDRDRLRSAVERHLPDLGHGCLEACVAALQPGCQPWRRVAARFALERQLSAHAGHPPPGMLVRRAVWALARALGAEVPRGGKRLATGGAVIGLVGGDGAGKSTCTRLLAAWLGSELDVRTAHLGRPPRSLPTLVVAGALRVAGGLPPVLRPRNLDAARGYLTLLWWIGIARDRYRLYRRVRRAATAGAVALCERYPIPENRALVGPSTAQGVTLDVAGRLAERLRRIEARYYARVAPPDLVLVLRVDPEIAVLRKPEEPESYVRARASIVWRTDWSRRRAVVVDAGQPLPAVVAELRARLWEAL